MIVKIVEIYSDGVFLLNGVPYQKGAYRMSINGDRIGISEIGSKKDVMIVDEVFSNWINEDDDPYLSADDLIDDLSTILFFGTEDPQVLPPSPPPSGFAYTLDYELL